MNRNNKFFKRLFAGILTLGLLFSTYAVASAAGGEGGGGGNGSGDTKEKTVSFVGAYLTTITGNVSTTGKAINGYNNVDVNPIIKLVFSNDVANSSVWDINKDTITLVNSNGNEVAINVSRMLDQAGNSKDDEKRNIFVSSKESLTPEKSYTLTIKGTLTANSKATLGQNETITFTVAEADGDQVAAQKVNDLITALPTVETLTAADKTAVENARIEYDSLTKTQQGLVTNVEKLVKLETRLADLAQAETDQVAAKQVEDLISSLPTVSNVTVAEKASIVEARKAYAGLTLVQKELVTNQAILVQLETRLAELETKLADKSSQADTNKGTNQNHTGQTGDNNKLPKTGDSSTVWTSLFGSILLALGLVMLTIKIRGKIDKSSI